MILNASLLSFSIVSAGDSVPVACYGFSLNNGRQYLSSNSTGKSGYVFWTLLSIHLSIPFEQNHPFIMFEFIFYVSIFIVIYF